MSPELQPPRPDDHIDWVAGHLAVRELEAPLREQSMGALLDAVKIQYRETGAEDDMYLYDPEGENVSFVTTRTYRKPGDKGVRYHLRTAHSTRRTLSQADADAGKTMLPGLDVIFNDADGSYEGYVPDDPREINDVQSAIFRSASISYGLFIEAAELVKGTFDGGATRKERRENKAQRERIQAHLDAAVAAHRARMYQEV